jgi:integrase
VLTRTHAGVNTKALSSYLGHSSIQITFDGYGHLMPGNEEEAVTLVDQHLRDKCATVGTPAERIPAGSGG